jgi:hypothetical protein
MTLELSDKPGNRKHIPFIGYALSSLSKPFMLIANAWGPVMAIRFADRFGRGICAAPRDALVGDPVDGYTAWQIELLNITNWNLEVFGVHKS